ncbi:aminotransferase class IV [Maribacter sp. X9]|uniref:aminotransferase class IV n=1 Tax=Maribacter sp. X9 TaxID=3402159 RepID=UPI003AF3B620
MEQGRIQNAQYHELRFQHSYFEYFGKPPSFSLFQGIELSDVDLSQKHKLKISYNASGTSWTITEYRNSLPKKLRLVFDDTIAYALKFTDREKLNTLYQQKKDCEDVLIVKNGLITDASYANILFRKGEEMVTPLKPLLPGTCRTRLLASQTILEEDVHYTNLPEFTSFQLINAMNDYNPQGWVSIDNILP